MVLSRLTLNSGKWKGDCHYDESGGQLITKDKFGYIRGFQLAGADQKFYWARAEIDGNQIKVYASDVASPVAVRYAWSNNPGPLDLVNEQGLPALPFRSDRGRGHGRC